MRWIALFAIAAALIATGVAKWNAKTISEPVMASGIDTFGLMVNTKDLPQENWQFRAPPGAQSEGH